MLTWVGFIIGLPLLFRRKLGDGRYFLLFWMFFWLQFSISGSKFTRYATFVLPAVYTTAAIGSYYVIRWVARRTAELAGNDDLRVYVKGGLAALLVIVSVLASVSAAPHYRLFTNIIGGGAAKGSSYFTQDDFYDAEVRQVMDEIARVAKPRAQVASETPTVCLYYAGQANRGDLSCVSLSDPAKIKELSEGDFIVAARGRHYLSNDALLSRLRQASKPAFNIPVGNAPAADVYVLDKVSTEAIKKTPP